VTLGFRAEARQWRLFGRGPEAASVHGERHVAGRVGRTAPGELRQRA